MIFDMKMMDNTMKEIGYDPKKMPLGKLADQTIKEGFQVLSELQNAIKANKKDLFNPLSSRFYSLIPHDFGFKPMSLFVINSVMLSVTSHCSLLAVSALLHGPDHCAPPDYRIRLECAYSNCEKWIDLIFRLARAIPTHQDEKVRQKLEMLQTLTDMKIATKLLKGGDDSQESQIDLNYKKLNCSIKPVSTSSEQFKVIQQFVNDGKEHYKPQIIDVFELDRSGEKERYDKKIGNDMLLWHGSRVSNFVGILSQGLRIAPPEAPVSGYNYGKGIYFADIFGKSANYCRSDTSKGQILIMLVEVAVIADTQPLRTESTSSPPPIAPIEHLLASHQI